MVTTFLIVFSFNIFSNVNFIELTLDDGSIISGELIGEYQQQWFWEKESSGEYIAVFNENSFPFIQIVNRENIKNQKLIAKEDSLYFNFLKEQSLVLKGSPVDGIGFVSTGNDGHHLFENMYGNFAWDFQKKVNGNVFDGLGENNHDHYIFGQKVYSPVEGTIVDIDRDETDHAPDTNFLSDLSDRGDGNYVLIHLFDQFYLSILHLKKNSTPLSIQVGKKIKSGQYIGTVGNSGVTYVPHLHMTLYYYSNELKRMMSIPTQFSNLGYVDSIREEACFTIPQTGELIFTDLKMDCNKID